MRKKTESRREAIISAATLEFHENGYDGASISSIMSRVGGSKQTLYNYFPSKDDLFIEVMARTITEHVDALTSELVKGGDLVQALCRYGERYLINRQSPDCLGLFRLAFGESAHSDIGRQLYQRGKLHGIAIVTEFLTAAMSTGQLHAINPTAAAFHFFGLLDAELFEPIILRAREPATTHEIADVVARAVSAFFAAYARPENNMLNSP